MSIAGARPSKRSRTKIKSERTLRPARSVAVGAIGALAVGAGVILPLADAEPANAAAEVPFLCTTNADAFLLQDSPSFLHRIDLVTGESVQGMQLAGEEVNAAGYNVLDDYIYASRRDGEVLRIGQDGVTELGMIPGVPEVKRVVGDVDEDGHYWTINAGTWYEVDLVPGSSSYMTVLDSGQLGSAGAGIVEGPDWAWVPGAGDSLWRVMENSDSEPVLVSFDMATGAQTSHGVIPGVPAIKAGAVYADADGYLYASDNDSGVIYRINIQDVTAEVFSPGPSSGANDGARCASSAIRTDFGDAPASFGTKLDGAGARHGIAEFSESDSTSPLMLGASVDAEQDVQPNAQATRDDSTGVNDEDGLVSALEVVRGYSNTLTVSATNSTDAAAVLAGWLDLNGDGTFGANESVSVPVPATSGTAEYQLAFPLLTTTNDTTYVRLRLLPEGAELSPTGPASAGEVEDHRLDVLERALEVEKTSNLTVDTRYGDTVTYSVIATNTGDTAYTDTNPAVVYDDLTGVLDDATYNGDASTSLSTGGSAPAAVYADPHLSWTGALAVGASVEITYTATLQAAGDGVVRNVAWQPATPPTSDDPPPATPDCSAPVDGRDPISGEPCATSSDDVPRLTVVKTSDVASLPASGGTVAYTVTVTNAGPGAYTTGAPAEMTDDLSAVLDDATFGEILSPSSGANFDADAELLTWSGSLAAGESVDIAYTVVYGPNGAGGDHQLVNTACIPADQTAGEPCASVTVPSAELVMSKSVDPSSGTTVDAGQQVTYILTFDSSGTATATVEALDDLSGVLDDATLGAVTAGDGLVATPNGDELVITGSIPAGETRTVSYTVTVLPHADQDDHVLNNVLSYGDGSCQSGGCPETENPIRHFSVSKVADRTVDVVAGDIVTYTVTVTNDGASDYTSALPAAFTDDLVDVLDDAEYNGDVVAIGSGGGTVAAPVVEDGVLGWSGALPVDEIVTVTYSVTVTNEGDHRLVNTAVPVCAPDVVCEPATPPVDVPLPFITPSKSSDPASGTGLDAGEVVTYTLTFVNSGQAAGSLNATDELAEVLDDATVTAAPMVDAAHAATVTATLDAETIRIEGALEAGATATVTYQVTVNPHGERGDNVIRNVVIPDQPPFVPAPGCDDCDPFVPPTTEHPLGELLDDKSVDPASGSTVRPGQEVAYTLTFRSIGEAPVQVNRQDVLTGVLDDATITAAPVASDPALTVSEVTDGRFSIVGTLDAGTQVTVMYTVTINPDGERGDDRVANALVPAGEDPAEVCESDATDCTVNYVSNVQVSKSVDPASGSIVREGDELTYTLTFRNVGMETLAAPVEIDYTDHLVDVLDDAELLGEPESSSAEVLTAVNEDSLRVTGAIATGETIEVVYSVRVKDYAQQGNHVLLNVVAPTGEEPICAAGSPLCTDNPTAPPAGLAVTGGQIAGGVVLAALLLLLLGGGLAVYARRGREHEVFPG